MANRARIVLPDDLLTDLDQAVGPNRRNEFIVEAVREKLLRLRHIRHVQEATGILPEDIPGWIDPDEISAWLRESRQRDVERLTRTQTHWNEA